MKRLFFGIEPDHETRQRCTIIMQALSSQKNRPVPAANLHVTLLFLGLIEPAKESALLEEAATVAFPQLTITFDQLSYWQKPGILCLTASGIAPRLLALVDQLSTIAKKLAVTVDGRPYQAHVTLVRKARQAVELVFDPVSWQADSFCLFESCPSENGVEYRVLKRWPME
ncbi:MAG: RNA 2',3'-cyclic phosphodiesterase [Methylovulum sp.]|uniref:RNA 2',3'-cyclic phosphodiesterase n=1 Tax=Methylovulum sp. TaxID=1916980 RepID=UPI0026064BA2|nr:RNA 2',3'-cyclic phosphodiesterase [Methylovulum sp.]MDD2722810.1 RNA 2',3'-cyclic phosphodiesterase [Methylovulum sp.]MDD5125529.1 RNA 2',3'-cyclic phosphodiesterase [Methylovulum sp.]